MADYLTVKEVAEACDVSLRTVRRWLSNRELEGAFQDPEGERRWHVPPLAIIDRLPSEADKDGTSPKKRGSLQHQLTETRHALDLEVNRRIAAERLADERKERIDEQVKAISFYQAAIEAPREIKLDPPKAQTPKPKKSRRTMKEQIDDDAAKASPEDVFGAELLKSLTDPGSNSTKEAMPELARSLAQQLAEDEDTSPAVEAEVDARYEQIDRAKESASKKKWWRR